jgi:DNA-binding helix-hairpin-helix protein with protein kinase domain
MNRAAAGCYNNSDRASSTDRTPTTRRPKSFSKPAVFDAGITIFLKPGACASRARTEAWVASVDL